LSIGYVNLLGFALIVPTSLATTGWCSKLAHSTHSINVRLLRQLLAAFLALTAARMFHSLLT